MFKLSGAKRKAINVIQRVRVRGRSQRCSEINPTSFRELRRVFPKSRGWSMGRSRFALLGERDVPCVEKDITHGQLELTSSRVRQMVENPMAFWSDTFPQLGIQWKVHIGFSSEGFVVRIDRPRPEPALVNAFCELLHAILNEVTTSPFELYRREGEFRFFGDGYQRRREIQFSSIFGLKVFPVLLDIEEGRTGGTGTSRSHYELIKRLAVASCAIDDTYQDFSRKTLLSLLDYPRKNWA